MVDACEDTKLVQSLGLLAGATGLRIGSNHCGRRQHQAEVGGCLKQAKIANSLTVPVTDCAGAGLLIPTDAAQGVGVLGDSDAVEGFVGLSRLRRQFCEIEKISQHCLPRETSTVCRNLPE